MQVTKDVTQEIADVTKVVTCPRISVIQITPLQPDETLDQTDTKTNKGHDDEHEEQRVTGNHGNERADPRNCFSNERSDRSKNSRDSNRSRQNQSFTKRLKDREKRDRFIFWTLRTARNINDGY